MWRTLVLAILLLAAVPPVWGVARACGDKYLMIGRGARFNQAYAAIYPATILLYAPEGRGSSPAILDPRFQQNLTRAGHRIEVVRDGALIAPTLRAGRFDMVLVDTADAGAIQAESDLSASRPTVVPVLLNGTKAQRKAITAQFHCKLSPSDKPARYLSTIDEEMRARVYRQATRKPS